MLVTIKRILFLPNTIFLTILFLFLIPFTPVLAVEVLTNGTCNGGTTGWTLTVVSGVAASNVYDSSIYHNGAGSVSAYTSTTKNRPAITTTTQTISTTIIAGSTVNLDFWWSKQCESAACQINTLEIRIIEGVNTYTVWSDTSMPAAGARTAWAQGTGNISSYFTVTGTYSIQIYSSVSNNKTLTSRALTWVDDITLDVIPPSVTTGTTGTQVSTVNTGETGKYIGGAFTMVSNTGTINVNSIQISEAGTLNANTYLHNVKLFYETAGTCTYDANETQYGTTTSFSSSEDATFSSTLGITTSQVCFYVVFDIDQNATADAGIEIEITNPSTDVTVDSGYGSSPGTTVAISGSTTVTAVASISITLTTDGSVSWGVMEAGSTKSTINISDTEVVQSNSNVNIDLDIKSSNATGGSVNWTLGATPDSDVFVYEHSSNSGSVWNTFLLADSYYTFVTGMTPSSTQNIDLRITVPNISSEYDQKTITITILATQSS